MSKREDELANLELEVFELDRQRDQGKFSANEPPWEELDPAIVPLVKLLRAAGLNPTSSCQGGEGHGFSFPTVIIPGSAALLPDLRTRAVKALLDSGHHGFSVSEHRGYQGSPEPWTNSYISVELWEGLS